MTNSRFCGNESVKSVSLRLHRSKEMGMDMTSGSILKLLIKFSVPLIFGYLFQQLYNTVDSIVVGNFVGKEALAAVGSTTSIINTLIGVFSGISTGASVVVAQAYGAGDEQRVHDSVHTVMLFVFYLSLAFTALGVCIVKPMLRLMDTPADVLDQASTYLTIYFAGISGLMIYNMGSGVLRAVGDSRRPLYFLIFSAVLNTGLDLLFVISFHMGVAGVAWATIISQFLSAILVVGAMMRSRECYRFVWREMKINGPILRRVLLIGLPTSIQMGLTAFSNVFVQSYINYFQSACMAGWAAYIKIDQFIGLTLQAMTMAVTTFVGQNVGANRLDRAKKGLYTTLWLLVSITAVEIAAVMLAAPPLVKMFNTDPEVVRYGTLFIRILSPFYPLCCAANVYAAGLRGAGDANAPMLILLGSFVLFRQVYLYVIFRAVGTVSSVALGYPAGWFVAALFMFIYYTRNGFDRHRRLKKKEAAETR